MQNWCIAKITHIYSCFNIILIMTTAELDFSWVHNPKLSCVIKIIRYAFAE